MFGVGQWVWNTENRNKCQVIDTQNVWGIIVYRVWIPEKNAVVQIREDKLTNISNNQAFDSKNSSFCAVAARVADTLTQDVLLAPIESKVIPLPHQILALSRATANDRIRYLLADEVGLGKTIEAGLIMRELKLRGLVKRTLIVVPRGLTTQWVAEMRAHFEEDFRLLVPGDFGAYRSILGDGNIWRSFDQVICPVDSVKPIEKRRGWSGEKVAEYNRERFDDLISAGWDLIIVDEAHRLGGSTDQVARFKLGQGLSEAAPYLLLLSATPHQGKTDAFHRILSILDSDAFPDIDSVIRDRVKPYVIRTEKRHAIDSEGKALFTPRRTELFPVSWSENHARQHALYEAVTEYVREGYNQAALQKRNYIGFLMILMQRLVASSTRAIHATLERRLEVLEAPEEQLMLFPIEDEEDWEDLDGQEQLDTILKTRLKALKNERAEVELLLEAAKRCEESGPDVKAEALLNWVYRLQQEENDPDLKVLIFTEFVSTQDMLKKFLEDRGFSVVCLNGSMDIEERQLSQETFAQDARVMVSTDAGGEGLNLQFCHIVINYDLPWNPMRLEQRIGRVDRIGQKRTVRAINLIFEDTIEHRVREVLEEKLAIIQKEFGIDKAGDVLDSAQAGHMFDRLYIDTILNPEELDSKVDSVINEIREQARAARESVSVLGSSENLNPDEAKRIMTHPLPHWVERMTVSYLEAYGGKVEKQGEYRSLTWPDGETIPKAVFSSREAEDDPSVRHLTLEDSRIRGLATRLSRFVPGQPIPELSILSLPEDVSGIWSLWCIAIHTEDWNRQRFMPLFIHDDGRCFIPTARRIWDQLLNIYPEVNGYIEGHDAERMSSGSRETAETQGRSIYEGLLQEHRDRLEREREKGDYAFSARRRSIERIGLPEVRDYRLNRLVQEEQDWRRELEEKSLALPDLIPVLFAHIKGGAK